MIYLLKVAVFIALFVVAIRFFVYLLPFIIIGLVFMLIYDAIKRSGFKFRRKRKMEVMEAEIISEKKGEE